MDMIWPIALAWLGFASLCTFGLFWFDKRRARHNGWRIPERVLLLWAAAGGWIGAKLAQQSLRHKTRKQPFGHLLNAIGLGHLLIVWPML
ncbi:DUF1294 domain-containing protein [Thalassococcus lentus]|uniref:DUF1294 domain-containing protein n=1 Tax=Thalassococcus lentus TaxID=1210524 RepID=A0ABT4XWU6_9RHOB|nr:DUF1294 domain-containing protein [Thalassococcus lentus]MDA7426429.1 DUF1294 domain-containing protein [Thalassococcus lentus]